MQRALGRLCMLVSACECVRAFVCVCSWQVIEERHTELEDLGWDDGLAEVTGRKSDTKGEGGGAGKRVEGEGR